MYVPLSVAIDVSFTPNPPTGFTQTKSLPALLSRLTYIRRASCNSSPFTSDSDRLNPSNVVAFLWLAPCLVVQLPEDRLANGIRFRLAPCRFRLAGLGASDVHQASWRWSVSLSLDVPLLLFAQIFWNPSTCQTIPRSLAASVSCTSSPNLCDTWEDIGNVAFPSDWPGR